MAMKPASEVDIGVAGSGRRCCGRVESILPSLKGNARGKTRNVRLTSRRCSGDLARHRCKPKSSKHPLQQVLQCSGDWVSSGWWCRVWVGLYTHFCVWRFSLSARSLDMMKDYFMLLLLIQWRLSIATSHLLGDGLVDMYATQGTREMVGHREPRCWTFGITLCGGEEGCKVDSC